MNRLNKFFLRELRYAEEVKWGTDANNPYAFFCRPMRLKRYSKDGTMYLICKSILEIDGRIANLYELLAKDYDEAKL